MNDSTSDKNKKIDEIYADGMAKLNELKTAQQQILTAAMKRVEEEQVEKIKQNLLKNSQ
jgi:mRNA-degrading endonuclease toxin of MazEF toxin-antitoxin module